MATKPKQNNSNERPLNLKLPTSDEKSSTKRESKKNCAQRRRKRPHKTTINLWIARKKNIMPALYESSKKKTPNAKCGFNYSGKFCLTTTDSASTALCIPRSWNQSPTQNADSLRIVWIISTLDRFRECLRYVIAAMSKALFRTRATANTTLNVISV